MIEDLFIPETTYTPKVELKIDGTVNIFGKSFPENSFEFYKPIKKWFENYCAQTSKDKLYINLKMLYMNSSSTASFFEIFDILDRCKDNMNISINWLYDAENDVLQELGEEIIEEFSDLNINLIEC